MGFLSGAAVAGVGAAGGFLVGGFFSGGGEGGGGDINEDADSAPGVMPPSGLKSQGTSAVKSSSAAKRVPTDLAASRDAESFACAAAAAASAET